MEKLFRKIAFFAFIFIISMGFGVCVLDAAEEPAQEGGLLGADFDVNGGKDQAEQTTGQAEEEEWSGERDDYDILSLRGDMTPVSYGGRTVQRLKNVDAAQVKIKMRGEEHTVEKYEATMLLLEKGLLKQVPGVGLITTEKYDEFMKEQGKTAKPKKEERRAAPSQNRDCSSKQKAFKLCQAKYGPRFSLTNAQLAEIAKKDAAWYRDVVECLKTQDDYLSCSGR